MNRHPCIRDSLYVCLLVVLDVNCVISLIWQHVSTSDGYLEASDTRQIRGIQYSCINFLTELSDSHFDKIRVGCVKLIIQGC